MFWIKKPIDVLSVDHVLQEITYKTVSQEAAAVENECWLTSALGLISFSTIWRVLIKSALGSPIMKTPSACHNELPEIFSMHEGFYFFGLIIHFNCLNDYIVSIIIHFILLSCYIKAIYHIFYFK